MLLVRINTFLTRYFNLFIIVSLIVGFCLSQKIVRFSDFLPYVMMVMVFILGTSCSFQSFIHVIKKPKAFIIGLLIVYIILPIVGLGLGKVFYDDSPSYALGHFLVAVSPIAVTSMVWTGFVGGNIVLSLAIILCTTVLSGVMVPFQVFVCMGKVVDFDAFALMISLMKLIVLPVIAGLLLRMKVPTLVEKVTPGFNVVNKFMMMMVLCINSAAASPYIQAISWNIIRMFLIVGLHLSLNFITGIVISRFALGKQSKELTAIIYASGLKNTATGSVIALHYFGAEVALPVIFFIFLQQLAAGGVSSFVRKFFGEPVKRSIDY